MAPPGKSAAGGKASSSASLEVCIPVSRGHASTRAMLWGSAAGMLGLIARFVGQRLDFTPSGTQNRLVDASLAVVALAPALGAILCAVAALRWLSLTLWPRRVGVFADATTLVLRLGPFGSYRYDADELEVFYPFELPETEADGGFEAFVPEEQQLATMLPRIRHPKVREPLNQVILRYACGSEAEIAAALEPVLSRWRSERSPAGQPEPGIEAPISGDRG